MNSRLTHLLSKVGHIRIITVAKEILPIVRLVLEYFYTLEYNEELDRRIASTLELHARMYTAGKKFGMDGLKRVGASRFDAQCGRLASDTTDTNTALGILANAAGQVYRRTSGADNPLKTSLVRA
ncbi:MAG: hypothetical protein Q9174_004327, partial [Haloplaca sp. 1 TL-2023]